MVQGDEISSVEFSTFARQNCDEIKTKHVSYMKTFRFTRFVHEDVSHMKTFPTWRHVVHEDVSHVSYMKCFVHEDVSHMKTFCTWRHVVHGDVSHVSYMKCFWNTKRKYKERTNHNVFWATSPSLPRHKGIIWKKRTQFFQDVIIFHPSHPQKHSFFVKEN